MPEDNDLTPAQTSAIAQLLAGHSLGDIAKSLDIDPKTLWRWRRKDEAFIQALQDAQESALAAVRDRLLSMADRALVALDSAMTGDSDTAKVQAARAVLDRVLGPVTAQQAPEPQRAEVTVIGTLQDLEREAERRMLASNGHQNDY